MKKSLLILIIAVASLILFFSLMFIQNFIIRIKASPPSFQQFYGTVKYANGSYVEDNTIVKAKFNSQILISRKTVNGKYGYTEKFIIEHNHMKNRTK